MPKSKKQPATVFDKTAPADVAAPVAPDAPPAEATTDATSTPAPDTAPPVATNAPTKPVPEKPAKAARKGRKDVPSPEPATTDPATPVTGASVLTMAGLRDKYIAALQAKGSGIGTVFSYGLDMNLAVRHFGEDTPVASLTARRVQNYFESDAVLKTRSGRGKARPGIDKTRRVLRLALVWAAENGLIPEAPIPESAKPRAKKDDAGEAA